MKLRLLYIASVLAICIAIGQSVNASPRNSIRADALSLPLQAPVLVLAYYPPDSSNPDYLDPVETGWTDILISDMQAATQEMVDAGQALINEATRYHGYKDATAPQYLHYYTFEKLEYFYPMPRGFPLGEVEYRPHYNQILNSINICDYVDNHGVKEVWIYGYHATVIVPDESKMSSKYGDVSNAYPKDEEIPEEYHLPRCTNAYVMYNFTYQPGGGQAIGNNIHNRMHQIENVIFFAENLGYPPNDINAADSLFWSDFSVYGNRASLPGYKASCGNTHSPPNTTAGYDYDSPEYRENNCETWHPDDSLTTYISANCLQWGCTDTGFYKWFMQNLPGYNNGIVYNGRQMRNWWEAMYDFNQFIDAGRSLYEPSDQAQAGEEKLIAHFGYGPNAITTEQEYSGLVNITVTGIGQASATQYSDAFYILTDNSGRPIEPWHPTLPYNWVLWINGQHAENFIPGQIVPPYRGDHTYSFEINAPGGKLTFGVGDVGTGDNTGSYTITVRKGNATCSVPFFSQRDPQWADHPLRTNGLCSSYCSKIGTCGCTLTSAAMVFAYYGASVTPKTLSDCMGTSACPFLWSTSCNGGTAALVGKYAFDWARLDREINSDRRPVILGMHIQGEPNKTHWVVVTSGHGNMPGNYVAHDPYPLNGADTNLAVLARQNYVFDWLAVYDGLPQCRSGSTFLPPEPDSIDQVDSPIRDEASQVGEKDPAFPSETSAVVSGTIQVYHMYETSLIVQLSANSTMGSVTEMQVWSDSSTTADWTPFETLTWLTWEPGDSVYVRFRDEMGNVSEVSSDTLLPAFSPPPESELPAATLYLPMVTVDSP